jgi:hypothetical protein
LHQLWCLVDIFCNNKKTHKMLLIIYKYINLYITRQYKLWSQNYKWSNLYQKIIKKLTSVAYKHISDIFLCDWLLHLIPLACFSCYCIFYEAFFFSIFVNFVSLLGLSCHRNSIMREFMKNIHKSEREGWPAKTMGKSWLWRTFFVECNRYAN